MRLLRDATGISKIILILLLVIAFIAGALFSYIYTMGYYAPFEFLLPDKPVFTIQSAEFSKQDTSFFDVTVVNPSYSQADVDKDTQASASAFALGRGLGRTSRLLLFPPFEACLEGSNRG